MPLVLCVMQGGLIFSGHLLPRLDCLLEVDYIHATRYNNETTGGKLDWKAHPATSLQNRTVLILDDILDELKTNIEALKVSNQRLGDEILYKNKVEKKRKEFIGSASHELKTPLSLIMGYAEALKLEDITEEEKKNYLVFFLIVSLA